MTEEVEHMSVSENKAIVGRFIEEVQSKHNLDLADELISPNMVDHYLDTQGVPHTNDAIYEFKKFYTALLSAFPDLTAVINQQVGEGDLVATYKTLHGTHKGEFRGVQPTGKRIALELIDFFRIAEGRISEHWAVIDLGGLMGQLGVTYSLQPHK
jgi:predicted ester cyclase